MPDQPEWDGVGRRKDFDAQVEHAAVWAAAQKDVEEKRRIVANKAASKAGWRSFFVCLLLLIPTVAITGHIVASNAKDNSIANCETQALGRPIGNIRAFTQQAVLGLADQAFSQYAPKIQQAAVDAINHRIDQDRDNFTGALGYLPNGDPRPIPHIKHFSDLGLFLNYLPPLNCSTQIQ